VSEFDVSIMFFPTLTTIRPSFKHSLDDVSHTILVQ